MPLVDAEMGEDYCLGDHTVELADGTETEPGK